MNAPMPALRAGLIALCLTGTAVALAADEKNLAPNGGFEDVKGGVPTGWFSVCSEGGSVTHKALADADIGEAAREQILHGNAAGMLARAARTGHAERAAAE